MPFVPPTYLKLSLTVRRNDGATVDMELLRPRAWVESQGLRVGRAFALNIPELEVLGTGSVHSISDCPELAEDDGSYVTGRFVTRRVEQTVTLQLEDGSSVEGTPIHPVWSLDRQDWVPMGELQVGELLQTENGSVSVASLTVHHRPCEVYNIEVHGEHVYQVGELGLLVHNACNLNANNAVSNFGIYEIRINNLVWKVGKADINRITKSSGLPTRLHQQVRQLEKHFGEGKVIGTVVQKLENQTTSAAKAAEVLHIIQLFQSSGFIPIGNLKSFFL